MDIYRLMALYKCSYSYYFTCSLTQLYDVNSVSYFQPPWAGQKQERHKWGEPVAMPAMPAMERPQWNSGEKSPFSQLPLEETASHMEGEGHSDVNILKWAVMCEI